MLTQLLAAVFKQPKQSARAGCGPTVPVLLQRIPLLASTLIWYSDLKAGGLQPLENVPDVLILTLREELF